MMVGANGEQRPLLLASQSSSSETVEQRTDHSNPRVLVVLVLLSFLMAMGFGATLGIVPSIMTEQFLCVKYDICDASSNQCPTNNGGSQEDDPCLQASQDAQTAASLSELVSNTLTLFLSGWIGSLSDVHGRKPFMLVGVVFSSLASWALLWTVHHGNTASPWVYYTSKAMNGLVHWLVLVLACVADVIPKQERAGGVGKVMAGFWLGLCVSPCLAVALTAFPQY